MANAADPGPPTPVDVADEMRGIQAEIADGDWRRAVFGLIFATVAYPSFALLDWVSYPDHLTTLLSIRAAVTALLLAGIAVLMRHRGYYTIQVMACTVCVVAGGGIALMTHVTEGYASPYYAGISLVLVALVAFTTVPPRMAVIATSLVLLSYYGPLPFFSAPLDWSVLLSNSFFLLSTAVVALLGTTVRCRLAVADARQRLDLARLNQRLSDLSVHDDLTGLRNRRGLGDKVEELILLHRRYATAASVIMIDLDNFKAVNDRFGHAAGDEALKAVAATMRATVRDTDLSYRLGGDEFLIVLPSTRADAALALARRLERALERVFADSRFQAAGLGCSIGVLGLPETADRELTAESFLAEVDKLLYRSKRQGKGRVAAFSG